MIISGLLKRISLLNLKSFGADVSVLIEVISVITTSFEEEVVVEVLTSKKSYDEI